LWWLGFDFDGQPEVLMTTPTVQQAQDLLDELLVPIGTPKPLSVQRHQARPPAAHFCPYCGGKLAVTDARFCNCCGQKIHQEG
jgi:hypothetical protein